MEYPKISVYVGIVIIGLISFSLWLDFQESERNERIANTTEELLETSKEQRDFQKASLESRYENFKANLNFRLHSLHTDTTSGNTINIFNRGIHNIYLKLNMELTAYCDKTGNKHAYDKRIFNDEEITLEKERGNWSISYHLPDDFLEPSKPAFEYRLWIETHPLTSQGYLEAIDDNKKAFIQYSYIEEDGKWTPEITSYKGGLDCNREPYLGDVRTLRYSDEEEHFLPR